MIEAAALERIVHIARAVGSEDDNWWRGCAVRAQFWDGDLKIGQHFKQVGLKFVVGAVDFVDQQHGRSSAIVDCAKQRALNQETLVVQFAFQGVGIFCSGFTACLGGTKMQQLARIVPVVYGLRSVNSFVALQTNQLAAGHCRNHFCKFGFAYAGFALKQQRSMQ